MLLPEYWGKTLLRRSGFPVPDGRVVATADQAASAAREFGGAIVLKVQVTAGKRGKGGGVRFAHDPGRARTEAAEMLGSTFDGIRVERLIVEEAFPIEHEAYVAVMNDARTKSPLILLSAEGGMDIETVNAETPERITRLSVDILRGVDAAAAERIVRACGFEGATAANLARFIVQLYEFYRSHDAELIEINPLAIGAAGALCALDCKMAIDDSAKRRHPELIAEIEADLGPSGTPREQRARQAGLLYIELDGSVGMLANGAGLTMATMDAIVHHGGRPSNFLEIGGDAYTKATAALEIVLSNPNVRSLVVNFCGAFARTDVMTEGVIKACQALRPSLPMFFCVHGTGEEEAQAMIRRELGLEPLDTMDEAVKAAVDAALFAASEQIA